MFEDQTQGRQVVGADGCTELCKCICDVSSLLRTSKWLPSPTTKINVNNYLADSVANLVSEILDLVSPKYFGMT